MLDLAPTITKLAWANGFLTIDRYITNRSYYFSQAAVK